MTFRWIDLLFLPDDLCDRQRIRRGDRPSLPDGPSVFNVRPPAFAPRIAPDRRSVLRLCLGIGDGQLRRQ